MKKDTSGQKIGSQMTTASNGTDFSGTVTCYVTGDAGTQALGSVGSGVCTHEGNGYYTYAPSQAETNYDLIAFTFIGTGAISRTVQVFTNFPQTADATASITTALGTAGAALTAIPWNAAWDAEVQSEVNDALVANNLDHLFLVACTSSEVTDNSFAAKITSKSATASFASFVNTTDSMEAIRDNEDADAATTWNLITACNDDVDTFNESMGPFQGTTIGAGDNTVYGWLKAIMLNGITTPNDIGGGYSCSVHSLMGLQAVGSIANVTNAVAITSNRKKGFTATFEFLMQSSTTGAPATGLTVAATISKDGGAPAATTNAVTEIGLGQYQIVLTATEMTANNIFLQFIATGAVTANLSIQTQP